MDQTLTYIFMVIITFISGFSLYKARKPKELGKSWHVPWNGLVFLGLMSLLVLIRHQFTLSGIDFPAR
ncbi:hypothetical protein MNBD_ALPHA03-61 [hydrothermal vent metagenome]|uniref:Uncharacterized protein n=1 Tax=hydrothermal vent metagenome TaxID=652676 RepID=A0A3B1AQM2_9ZZZZ